MFDQKKKYQWHQFGILQNDKDLEDYLSGREYSHTWYCHYTPLFGIDKIVSSHEFFISSVDGFNDSCDSRQFNNESKKYYSLCFSTGLNENLALWYLYSGIDGKGGRVRFGQKQIRTLVEKGKYSLWEYENRQKKDKIADLEMGRSMQVIFKDLLYYKNKADKLVDLKYNTLTNYNKISEDSFNEYQKNNCGFSKDLIWYYEKETRLLVELLDVKLDRQKDYVVSLEMPKEIWGKFNIDFAPEVQNLEDEMKLYDGIRSYCYESSNVGLSDHSGKINMQLKKKFCQDCTEKVKAE